MRITLIFILSLFFSVTVGAQELIIKSFTESPNDLSARVYPRLDNNDVPCALVKVYLASAGAIFEGAVMGNVEYRTGEYRVYMPEGSKRLTVKLEGYLPLPVEFPTPLESNVTYVLTISGVVMSGQQPQEVRTKTGWIIIDSEPQGAAVYINNEFVGNTPLDSYKQPYGTYSYKVEKPNYHSASGTIELSAPKFERKETLPPAFGTISVSSDVSGATVLLDGKDTGSKTPCTLTEIPSGSHTVTLQKNKYAPRQLQAEVTDGNVTTLTASLNARFARVSIETANGAGIYIDNDRKGTSSYSDDLMEGYYDVEVRLSHHRNAMKQIHVVAGEPQNITLAPIPIYGSLDVTSTPRDATVTVDSKSYGSTPLTIDELLEGTHHVTISLAGYASESKTVTISENETATVSATLQSGRQVTISTKEPGSTIYIDGKEAGPSPYTVALSFGTHTAYAMLNGKKTFERRIASSQGEGALEDVVLSFITEQTITVNGVSFRMIAVEGEYDASDSEQAANTPPRSTVEARYHKVAVGETLTSIAIRRGTTVDKLCILNHLSRDVKVKPGQLLLYINTDICSTFTNGATSEQGSDADSDEKPAHQVTLSGYYIGETEVTQALWTALMGDNPSGFKGSNLPVENVSWDDCQTFITRLNQKTGKCFRLPTEAEWEFAARGGNKSRHTKYSGSNNIDEVAWYSSNSGSKTHPVKTKSPNELGIYDMSGNVWEWCQDWYGNYSSNAQTNPRGPNSGSNRVDRGGSWSDDARYCRSSNRDDYDPVVRFDDLGFRLALSE